MNDKEYEEESNKLDKALKPFLTDEFLSVLIKAGRTCGWSVDYTETKKFIRQCFDIAEKELPTDEELSPFMRGFD